MIEIKDNMWRPFIKLTAMFQVMNEAGEPTNILKEAGYTYYDVNKHPTLLRDVEDNATFIYDTDRNPFIVKETPDEIIEAVEKLIKVNQDKMAEEAHKQYEETMKHVEETKKQLKGAKK